MFTGKTAMQLLKEGWDLIPETVIGGGMTAVGLFLRFILLILLIQ